MSGQEVTGHQGLGESGKATRFYLICGGLCESKEDRKPRNTFEINEVDCDAGNVVIILLGR